MDYLKVDNVEIPSSKVEWDELIDDQDDSDLKAIQSKWTDKLLIDITAK